MILQLEQARLSLGDLKDGINDLGESIGYDTLTDEVNALEMKTTEAGFWDKPEQSQVILKQLKHKKGTLERYNSLKRSFADIETLIDIAIEEDDESIVDEVLGDLEKVKAEYERQKIEILLSGEYDDSNAILSIHPGAGGTEAQDWALMLFRMYQHYAEKHGFKFKVLDMLDGEEAGLKSVSFEVEGENAYGYLKSEAGVHRLVRVSPFDASGRRHTSFASVEVLPEFDENEMKIEINEADLKIEAHRSSGAGGQHINKTDSAIRITHIPTGIVVGCQTERSQVQNRETAMRMLKSKLLEIKEREHLEKIDDINGTKMNIEWGSQIRSYVFMPYTLVKDNRTNCETGNIQAVMDGDLDDFINEYLKYTALKNDKK